MKVRGGPDHRGCHMKWIPLPGRDSRRVFLSRVPGPTHDLPLLLPFLAPSFLLLTLGLFHRAAEA